MKFFKKTKYDKIIQKICFIIFLYVLINMHILYSMSVKLSIGLVIVILGIIAFFCFAWDKKFLNKRFWQTVFVLSILWKGYSVIPSIISFNSWNQIEFSSIVFLTLVAISYIYFPLAGLYYYTFRNDIWNKEK